MMACKKSVDLRSSQSEVVECREHPPRVKAINYSRVGSYRLVCSVSHGPAASSRRMFQTSCRVPSLRLTLSVIQGAGRGHRRRRRRAPSPSSAGRSGSAIGDSTSATRAGAIGTKGAPPPRGTVNTLVRPFRKTLLGPSQGHCLGDSAARSTTVVIAPGTRLVEVASRAAILLHPVIVEIISKALSRIMREGQMTVPAGIPRRGSSRGCRG